MEYSTVADAYAHLESTSGRNEMTEILASLLKETPISELRMLAYLTQGKLRPDYEGVELGLAEKLALRVLGSVSELSTEDVYKTYVKLGDIGTVAEQLLSTKGQATLAPAPLTLKGVYGTLTEIAGQVGAGSVELKLRKLSSLLNEASPREARYIMRTVTGELRLGVADYTMLDACALAFLGSKAERKKLERAYNVHPDIGFVVETVALKKRRGIAAIKVQLDVPIRPMLAERLESAQAIIRAMGNKRVAAEYKLDGERLQLHKAGSEVTIFSRRLERITESYPDAASLVKKSVKAKAAILEAEVVAINDETGEYLAFQELMHRRRKHGIERAVKEYPVALNFFDLLYLDGEDMTPQPYASRRSKLERIVVVSDRVKLVPAMNTADPDEIESFMEEAIQGGCEGLVVKDPDANYRAGAREFGWIKLKREYRSDLTDSLDLVVIGGFHGRGRRAGVYGAYLLAAYDDANNVFTSISKIGTGFSDEDLQRIPRLLKKHESRVKPPDVESKLEPDTWFKPHMVLETVASEVTLSPTHTAGFGKIREGSGIALRFPKFTGKIRDDKTPRDATTVDEIIKMYRNQVRRVGKE